MDRSAVTLFFSQQSNLLPLYLDLEAAVRAHLGEFDVIVQKSQITWKGPGSFAALWLPRWKRPDRQPYVGLSFFLEFKIDSPRIPYSVEPYPGRWTHHTSIAGPEEMDEELLGWLYLSREFSGRRRQRKC